MWRGLNTWFAVVFLIFFVGVESVDAAPARAYSGKVNKAVAGVIQKKLNRYGFAANDPRIGATVQAASWGLTELAGGAAAVALGAATWPVVLAGAGIAAVVGGAMYLGEDRLVEWLWGDDGSVTLSGPGMGSADPSTLGPMPGTWQGVWDLGEGDRYVVTADGKVRLFRNAQCYGTGTDCSARRDANFELYPSTPPVGTPSWFEQSQWYVEKGHYRVTYEWVHPTVPVVPPGYTPSPLTPQEAIEALPEAVLEQDLSPEMLAAISNDAWKGMQGHEGMPWPATDPITPADVAEWLRENPDDRPTVGDFVGPVAGVGDQAVPLPLPGTSVTPSPTPGEGQEVDLGDDPNTPAPEMEDTPTARMILEPVLGLMPELRAFSVPAHVSECPRPEFEIFGTTHRWEAHCELMEKNRSLLEMAMLLVWSLSGVFIVLRA